MRTEDRKWIMVLLFTGVLMGALDISIVGPAIPSIEEHISIEPRLLGWIFSIYVLFNLLGISLFARLSDIYGRRWIYITAVGIFALGSVIVSLAGDFQFLMTGRAVQGFGASGFLPVASALIGDIYPPDRRGRMLGLIGAVFGIAFIIGPVIAGVLLHFFSWNVLFMINVPIAAGIILAGIKILPDTGTMGNKNFDWPGIIFLGLGLGAFAYGINNLDSADLAGSAGSAHVLPYLLASAVFAVLTVIVERRAAEPILKLGYFRRRQIRIAGITALATGFIQSTFVFIPSFAALAFTVSPSKASFMLLPIVLATAVGSPSFGRAIDSYGSRVIIIIGLLLSVAGYYSLSSVGSSRLLFYASGVLIGLGMSILSGSALRYILLNEVSASDRAVSQGMLTIFISLGQIAGAAGIGVVVASAGTADSYRQVFLILSILLVPFTLNALQLKKKDEETQGYTD